MGAPQNPRAGQDGKGPEAPRTGSLVPWPGALHDQVWTAAIRSNQGRSRVHHAFIIIGITTFCVWRVLQPTCMTIRRTRKWRPSTPASWDTCNANSNKDMYYRYPMMMMMIVWQAAQRRPPIKLQSPAP